MLPGSKVGITQRTTVDDKMHTLHSNQVCKIKPLYNSIWIYVGLWTTRRFYFGLEFNQVWI